MSECGHNCSECRSRGTCSLAQRSGVKKVIAVMSGKGGVGKSLVTELLAVSAAKRGLKSAILDADITGPSIPAAFGLKSRVEAREDGALSPALTSLGIKVMSLNLLVDDPATPVLWRGPVIAARVREFWTSVDWGECDLLFVDMPPGTGDVPLTVFQSLPIAGVVIVTSPQDVVKLIVEKAIRMAKKMNKPILALVENMSYFRCPECGHHHALFGASQVERVAAEAGVKRFAALPIDPELAKAVDGGTIETADTSAVDTILDALL